MADEKWKMVPIESTGPMVNAAWEKIGGMVGTGTIDAIYTAMIEHAPRYEVSDTENDT